MSRPRSFVTCLGALLWLTLLNVTPAAAQFTAEGLLKSSIEQIGPQHREVGDAIEKFKKGAFLECRNLLKSARQKDPKLPPDGVLMAQMLYSAKQGGLGRAELERTVREEPTDPEPYLLFGEIAFQERRFADAELSFKRAYELTKQYNTNKHRKNNMVKRSLSGMAGVFETREDWANAERFLGPILKANPKDVANSTRMARAIFEQDTNIGDAKGRETEAYDLLIALWKADQKNVRRPEITMGSMYQAAGNKDITANLMKKASEQDTGGIATQLTVARWALGNGDTALAQKCSDRAAQIAPKSIEARLVAGLTARYKKDYARARKVLEAAHLQSPSNLAAILQLAVVLVEGGADDKAAALEYSTVASRIYPDMGRPTGREAAVTSAWILYRQGRQQEAQLVLQKALAGGNVSAESSYYAARIIHQNNPDVAKRLLGVALKGDGVFPARPDAEKLLTSLGG